MRAAGDTVSPRELNSDFHLLRKCWAFSVSLQFRGSWSCLGYQPTLLCLSPGVHGYRAYHMVLFTVLIGRSSSGPLSWGGGGLPFLLQKEILEPARSRVLRQVNRRTDTLSFYWAAWIQEDPQSSVRGENSFGKSVIICLCQIVTWNKTGVFVGRTFKHLPRKWQSRLTLINVHDHSQQWLTCLYPHTFPNGRATWNRHFLSPLTLCMSPTQMKKWTPSNQIPFISNFPDTSLLTHSVLCLTASS